MNNNGNRAPIVEALILSSPEPLPTGKIINILQNISAGEIDKIVAELNNKYMMNDSSFRIRKIAGGYQIYITENFAGYVEELFTRRRTQKLTRAALETLAIIAYRQPVTRVDIEMIRGVSSDSAIRTLLERKFISLSGRAKTIGRPLLYSTTNEFLKYFSLNSLNDLPSMEEIEELLSEKESETQQILAFESASDAPDNNNLNGGNDSGEHPATADADNSPGAGDKSMNEIVSEKIGEAVDGRSITDEIETEFDAPEEEEKEEAVES